MNKEIKKEKKKRCSIKYFLIFRSNFYTRGRPEFLLLVILENTKDSSCTFSPAFSRLFISLFLTKEKDFQK